MLIERAHEMSVSRERLRRLLIANRSIVGELSLPAVLNRVVEVARDIAEATYAALGVLGNDGEVEQFVHLGMDPATVAAIGEPPKGRGVLGAVIQERAPIRIDRIVDDPRYSGFPAGHPTMRSFLGVPIRSKDAVFGNLYLADRVDGGAFTAEDEELVLALAATAGIAIENARLYEESRRRQEWLRASAEITRALFEPNEDDRDLLNRIADSVKRLADADIVTLVLPSPDPAVLQVAVARGIAEAELLGLKYPAERSLVSAAMESGEGILVDSVDALRGWHVHLQQHVPVGPLMTFPLIGSVGARGAIMVGRLRRRQPFDRADLAMAETFASHAAVALEFADARMDQQRIMVLQDRDRIARDLHDHVIQRIFATGLSVQSAAARIQDPSIRQRVEHSVQDLDDTIHQIRTSIFELRDSDAHQGLRSAVLHATDEVSSALGFRPMIRFSGPVDASVDRSLIKDVEAVVREGLTNVAKHAEASWASVSVESVRRQLIITIADNGLGIRDNRRRSGLANLRARAERRGGHLDMLVNKGQDDTDGGTRLRWTTPLPK
ncbi:two-component system sensor histidine kinase [Microlunatus panaciterrae]